VQTLDVLADVVAARGKLRRQDLRERSA
jgi:hypothetical protein